MTHHRPGDTDRRGHRGAERRFILAAALGLALAALAAGGGCGGIGGADDRGEAPDAGAAPAPCESSLECSEPGAPVCIEGTCRECAVSADCTASASAPVCDADELVCRGCASQAECGALACDLDGGFCRSCAENSECDSLVCDRATGACLAESEVIYADAGSGLDGPGCGTRSSPCKSLGGVEGAVGKVGDGRSIIKLVGAAVFAETLELDDFAGRLVGPGTIDPPGAGVPAASVSGASVVELDEVTFTGAEDRADGNGIDCGAGASLTLFRAVIADNEGQGILAEDCTVTLVQSLIARNQNGLRGLDSSFAVEESEIAENETCGVSIVGGAASIQRSTIAANLQPGVCAFQGTLSLERSRLLENPGGGVLVNSSAFVIRNNFIAGNGIGSTAGSGVGGVRVGSATASDILELNTIVDNVALDGGLTVAPGIHCNGPSPLLASGNIVRGGSVAVVSEACTLEHSNIQGGADPAKSNIDADPKFVDAASGDYHLREGSPCIDAADPSSTADVDIDGDARPQGAGPDIGADEVAP
jgi:hypothetical protein